MNKKHSIDFNKNFLKKTLTFIAFFCICIGTLFAAPGRQTVGSGSYCTNEPPDASYEDAPSTIYKTSNVTSPLPSNEWWSSLLVDADNNPTPGYSYRFFAYPLAFKCYAYGLAIGYPTPKTGSRSWPEPGNYNGPAPSAYYDQSDSEHLIVQGNMGSSVVTSTNPLVDGYSDWAVKAKWFDQTYGTNTFTATMGQGFVFTYFNFVTGLDAKITPPSGTTFTMYNANTGGEVTSLNSTKKAMLGVLKNGTTVYYGFFVTSNSDFDVVSSSITIALPADGYLAICILPGTDVDSAKADLNGIFEDSAYAEITDTQVSWSVGASSVTTTFDLTTTQDTALVALFPHQWKHTVSPSITESDTFTTLRGAMKLLTANSFEVTHDAHGIMPYLSTYDDSTLRAYLGADVSTLSSAVDGRVYEQGKNLYKAANVLPLVEQLEMSYQIDTIVTFLSSTVRAWLDYDGSETDKCFYYNSTWGTMIGYKDEYISEQDPGYGSARLISDHHFQFGYFVYASAILAMYDPSFASEYGGMVELLIKDYACPVRPANQTSWTEKFPFLRNFSPYEGHSWASGIAPNDDGADQESSAEAMLSWAAIHLWGQVTGNQTYKDLGMWGYSVENAATHDYYFDIDDDIYPGGYNKTTVGILFGGKSLYDTWFGSTDEDIHGIQFTGIGPSMLYLGHDPTYLAENYAEIGTENEDKWYATIWAMQALYNPSLVLAKYNSNTPSHSVSDPPITKSFLYYWIKNLDAIGQVDTTVYADNGTYAVFDKSGIKTYLVYNASDVVKTVNFYNRGGGLRFSVDVPSTTFVKLGPPQIPSNFNGTAVSSTSIQFTWTDNSDDEDGFKVYSSTDWLMGSVSTDVVTWTQTGLTANTSSYVSYVRGYNSYGESEKLLLGDVIYSSANVPESLDFSQVWRTSATLTWTANENPTETYYDVELATTSAFDVIISSSGWEQDQFSHSFTSGLDINTTYYARVRARNGDNIATEYSSFISTMTWANVPVFSGFTSVSSDTASVAWTDNGNPEGTEYQVEVSTKSDFSSNVTASSWKTDSSHDFSSLLINTTYYARVKARNGYNVDTAYSVSGSTITHAAVPVVSAFTNVSSSTLRVNWVDNGNPAGTEYKVEASSDPSFNVGVLHNGWQTTFVYDFNSGLIANTTYYGRVKARNVIGVETEYAVSGTTITWAGIPVVSEFTNVSSNTMSVNWTGNGNPVGTEYQVEISTTSGFTSGVIPSSWKTDFSHDFSSLLINTTYYAQVKARNGYNVETVYSVISSTVTHAKIPVMNAFTSVSSNTVTANWTDNGNPAGTEYKVEISNDPSFYTGVLHNGWQTTFVYDFDSSIIPNTTYYGRVKARNSVQSETGYAVSASTVTLASFPGVEDFSGVAGTAFDANWLSNGNPSDTEYWVQLSTEASFSPILQENGWQTNNWYRFTSLDLDTIYYTRVKAKSRHNIETTYTVLGSTRTLDVFQPIDPTNFTGIAISNTNIRFTWTDNSDDEDEFRIYSSTGYLMKTLGSDVTEWETTGLTANTSSYALLVRAYNIGGESGGARLPGDEIVYSSANVPSSAYFYDRWQTSATYVWQANGNSTGTQYYVEISSRTDFNPSLNSGWQTDGFSYEFTSLIPNTTYYGHVKSRNGNNVETAYTTYVSTVTFAKTPANGSFINVDATQIEISWQNNGNSIATQYRTDISTQPDFSSIALQSPWQTDLSYIGSALTPNTIYHARVKARNADYNETTYLTIGSSRTPANLPGIAVFTNISSITVRANWTSNGNPTGTEYWVELSTKSGINPILKQSSWQTELFYVFSDLIPETTYYAQVKARDTDNRETAYVSLGSNKTALPLVPVPPSGFSGVAVSSTSIRFSWTDNADNEDGFRIYSSTDGLVKEVNTPDTISWLQTGLTANTSSYAIKIKAYNSGGESSAVSYGVVYTSANVPMSDSFTNVWQTSVTVNWNKNGNSNITWYQTDFSLVSDFSSFIEQSGWLMDKSSYTFSTNLLPNTTYYSRVKARNSNNIETSYGDLGSVVTAQLDTTVPQGMVSLSSTSPLGCGTYVVTLRVFANSSINGLPSLKCVYSDATEQIVSLSQASVGIWTGNLYINSTDPQGEATFLFSATDQSENVGTNIFWGKIFVVDCLIKRTEDSISSNSDGTRVEIDAYSFDEDVFVVITDDSLSAAHSEIAFDSENMNNFMKQVGLYRTFTMTGETSGNTITSFTTDVRIIIPYPDVSPDDGIVDGTVEQASNLRIYHFDPGTSRWIFVENSQVDQVNKVVFADVKHFSLFAVLPMPSGRNVSDICGYPNPFYPEKDHYLRIDCIPINLTDIKVEIYDITGRIVRSFDQSEIQTNTSRNTKLVLWNGLDDNNSRVASGVYIYVVRSGGTLHKEKIAVFW